MKGDSKASPAPDPEAGLWSSGASTVRVCVRCRPLIPRERLEQCSECVSFPAEREIVVGASRQFTFDAVFAPKSQQRQLYESAAAPLIKGCLDGYNGTVFAYGQTGSGKTYTMGTSHTEVEDEAGVIPRAIDDLFEEIERESESSEFLVRASFLEIYREHIRDLLFPDTPTTQLNIREGPDGDIFVAGARDRVVTSREDVMELLHAGGLSRVTGSTLMNAQSSRSHAIFTLVVERRRMQPAKEQGRADGDGDGEGEAAPSNAFTCAKLHLVDLAGSERAKRTGASGARFQESVTINRGLLALGNVISALTADAKGRRRKHIPYRGSKLTRLLQDSLGGNARTLMVACISPADTSFEETLNTLKYASRARHIQNRPVVNTDAEGGAMSRLRTEISQLQGQLQQYQLLAAAAVGEDVEDTKAWLRSSAAQAALTELRGKLMGRYDEDEGGGAAPTRSSAVTATAAARLEEADRRVEELADQCALAEADRDRALTRLADVARAVEDVGGTTKALRRALEAQRQSSGSPRVHNAPITPDEGPEARRRRMRAERRRKKRESGDFTAAGSGGEGHEGQEGGASGPVTPPASPSAADGTPGAAARRRASGEVERVQAALEELVSRALALVQLPVARSQAPAEGGSPARPGSAAAAPTRLSMASGPARPATEGAQAASTDRPDARRLEARATRAEQECGRLRAELKEAQANLKRDEALFAEKMGEVGRLTQRLRATQAETQRLREHAMRLEQQVQRGGDKGDQRDADETGSTASTVIATTARRTAPEDEDEVVYHSAGSEDEQEVDEEDDAFAISDSDLRAGLEASLLEEGKSANDLLAALEEAGVGGDESGEGGEGVAGGVPDHASLLRRLSSASASVLRKELSNAVARLQATASERERMAKERDALASAKQDLDGQLVQLTEERDRQQRELSTQLQDLESRIQTREERIAELKRAEEEAHAAQERAAQRARHLEGVVQEYRAKVEEVEEELAEAGAHMSEQAKQERQQREGLQRKFKAQLAQAEAELDSLRREKERHMAALREQQASEARAKAMGEELAKLRKHRADLRARLRKGETQEKEREAAIRAELGKLRREAAKRDSRVRELESENERQRKLLRRRTQEVQAARRRRTSGEGARASVQGTQSTPKRRPGSGTPDAAVCGAQRARTPQQRAIARGAGGRPHTVAQRRAGGTPSRVVGTAGVSGNAQTLRRPSTAPQGRPGGDGSPADVGTAVEAVTSAVRHAVDDKETRAALRKAEKRRRDAVAEREACEQRRSALAMRKLRMSAAVEEGLRTLASQIQEVDDSLTEHQRVMGSSRDQQELENLRSDVSGLRERRQELWELKAELERRRDEEEFLSPEDEEELNELDDRVEALDAEVEFKDGAIAAAKLRLYGAQGEGGEEEEEEEEEDKAAGARAQGEREAAAAAEGLSTRAISDVASALRTVPPQGLPHVARQWVQAERARKDAEERGTALAAALEEERRRRNDMEAALRQAEARAAAAQKAQQQQQQQQQQQGGAGLQTPSRQQRGQGSAYEKEGEDSVIVGSSQVEDEASGVVLFDAGDSPGRGTGGDGQPVGDGEFERMKDQQIAMLQRDAYFHREANRELKRRLRDMDKRGQAVESRTAAQEGEMRKLRDVNASLMEELANLKEYLRDRGTAKETTTPQPVRVARRSLRELSTHEVQSLRRSLDRARGE